MQTNDTQYFRGMNVQNSWLKICFSHFFYISLQKRDNQRQLTIILRGELVSPLSSFKSKHKKQTNDNRNKYCRLSVHANAQKANAPFGREPT